MRGVQPAEEKRNTIERGGVMDEHVNAELDRVRSNDEP
jgi:hypothetical protein